MPRGMETAEMERRLLLEQQILANLQHPNIAHLLDDQAELLLTIDDALERLTSLNERLTRVVECRFFAGLTEQDTAEALELSVRTVQRDWMKGKAWLRRELAAS